MLPAEKNPNNDQPEQLQLITEPYGYHKGGRGFFATLVREPAASRARQHVYTLDRLPWVLEHLNPKNDTWLSQGEFSAPNRRVVNLARIGLAFVDLDSYKTDRYRDLRPEVLAQVLRAACADSGLPAPSLILWSGRGLQIKWIFDRAIPAAALPRWNAVQRVLCDTLAPLGADKGARDASRVLRVEHTVNTKSGEIVRVLDASGTEYDFDTFADAVLPLHREQVREQKQLRLLKGGKGDTSGLRRLSPRQLAWDRLYDLRQLGRLRGGFADQKTTALHWQLNFMLLSGCVTAATMYHEAAELAKQIGGGEWQHQTSELSTLYRKACSWAAGESIEFAGKKYPALYTPKNDTLIGLFGITDDEQRQLKTIISDDEAARRHRDRQTEARRKAGAVSREEYRANAQAAAAARAAETRRLRSEGLSFRQIAERLGISVGSVHSDLSGG